MLTVSVWWQLQLPVEGSEAALAERLTLALADRDERDFWATKQHLESSGARGGRSAGTAATGHHARGKIYCHPATSAEVV